MKYSVVSGVLLLALPLTLGSICWRNVSVPHVKWGKQYVSRTGICDAKCWGRWHELDINSDYYRDTCELEYKTELLPECCPGYEKDPRGECHPVCNGGCINGKSPNTCHCLHGYRPSRTAPNSCEPICDPNYFNTNNGQCTAPNVLRCNEGFLLKQESNLIYCKSRCSPECVNAHCLPDGTCRCLPEFIPAEESPHICESLCDPPCENSTCIGPNQCKCWDGYQPTLENVCSPFCDPAVVDCSNGSCVNANTCICDAGLELIAAELNVSSCYPACVGQCTNGFCPTSAEVCECLPGYNRTTVDEDCTPVCEDMCLNGACTAPGVCTCDVGFVLQNEMQEMPRCARDAGDAGRCKVRGGCRRDARESEMQEMRKGLQSQGIAEMQG
ncbi:hypothetical protein quinque_004346 [Culex quinquefasciatus]